jgi:hypothetical protein
MEEWPASAIPTFHDVQGCVETANEVESGNCQIYPFSPAFIFSEKESI